MVNRFILLLAVVIAISACEQKAEESEIKSEIDMSMFEKEIELRLREYEDNLRNGDSIALGEMYMLDAEIIPSTLGRENIIKAFGAMIRDSITGSSFTTTQLWGNDQLLVEEGTGSWYHTNGEVLSRGRYLLVWKKDDGQWKILRDTWFPEKKN
jgi:ketosteroid isomerase-like protein